MKIGNILKKGDNSIAGYVSRRTHGAEQRKGNANVSGGLGGS